MPGLTTVVVVCEVHTASACAIVALCAEHTAMLETARWARIEEVVGFSSLMYCEACALILDRANSEPAAGSSGGIHAGYLRVLDRDGAPRSHTPSCA
jgi:hypothetical protein